MKKIMFLLTAVFVLSAATLYAQTVPQGNSVTDKLAWLGVYMQSGGNYLIEVKAKEFIGGKNLSYSGKSNITITLRSVGANQTLSTTYFGTNSGNMFIIGSGVTLVLDNITLEGANTSPLVKVDGGTLIMNNGTVITGAKDSAILLGKTGGGVGVSSGTFTMNGGTISGNNPSTMGHGGGVGLTGGTFTMNGGTISGNSTGANGEGGGVYVGDGTFTMNGGTISGNSTDMNGYGGGGVHVAGGTFTMNGGTISGNNIKAINDIGGGGVYVAGGIFMMKGGTITGNTSSTGGGVYVRRGTFAKTGGTITGYGSDRDNGNVTRDSMRNVLSFKGHAVYAEGGSSGVRLREGTAGPGDNLSYNERTSSGAWDNTGTSAAPTPAPAPAAQPAPAPAPAPRPQPQQQNQPAPRPQQPTPTPAPAATPTPAPQTTVQVPTQLQGTWKEEGMLFGFGSVSTIIITNTTFRYYSNDGSFDRRSTIVSLAPVSNPNSKTKGDFPSGYLLTGRMDNGNTMNAYIYIHNNRQRLICHENFPDAGNTPYIFKKQ